MHTIEKGTVNVPAFLTKLWKIVEDSDYNHLICWGSKGKSFIIKNQSKFSKELLPLFFKHNNMASFIRQLNMYGFRKLTSIENSGLRTMDKDDMEFYHQYFVKGQESLLELIKRKATPVGHTHGAMETTELTRRPDDLTGLLNEIHHMKGRQESVDMMLMNMQKENETLWREVAILRQKSQKQQQLVDKLIHFLISLVRPRSVLKRKFPLMIDGVKEFDDGEEEKKCRRLSGDSDASKGPAIHDITDNFLQETNDECDMTNATANNDINAENDNSHVDDTACGLIQSPLNNIDESMIDPSILDPLQSAVEETLLTGTSPLDLTKIQTDSQQDSGNEASGSSRTSTKSSLNTPPESPKAESTKTGLDLVPSSSVPNFFNREPFNEQLEGIETELGWLQEQLSSGAFNIDSNQLLNLFMDSESDPSYPMPSTSYLPKTTGNEIVGNELIQYVPSSTSPYSGDDELKNLIDSETGGGDRVTTNLLAGEEVDLTADPVIESACKENSTIKTETNGDDNEQLDLDSFLNIPKT